LGFLLLPELILLLPFQLVILQCASQHIVTFGLFLIVFNLLFQLSARQLAIWHLRNLNFEIWESADLRDLWDFCKRPGFAEFGKMGSFFQTISKYFFLIFFFFSSAC